MNRTIRLLHLEDSPRDADLIRQKLEIGGLACDIVLVNGREGFESALAGDSFDLILCDYNLPNYDGKTALKFAGQRHPLTPVILISGTLGEEDGVECLKIGATDYVLKQRLERLVPCVKRALQEAEEHRVRIKAEAALRESEDRYRLVLNNSMDAILLTAPDGSILQANPAACGMFGRIEEELQQTGMTGVVCEDDPQLLVAVAERNRSGRFAGELTFLRRDGSRFPAELSSTVFTDPAGRALTSMTIRDITARKQAENALRAALAEQTALLKEVHHRVKNNLQIVVSLLSLQARQVTNEVARETLRDTEGRIRSLALLHETLYRQGTASHASIEVYFEKLCTHLGQCFGAPEKRIRIEKRLASVNVDLDHAIPCGLILNELVTNAFKHAFPDGRPGRILVEFRADSGSNLTLIVADDGVGLPAGLESQKADTLGLRLIRGLVAQLGGTMEMVNDPGSVFRITFPYSPSPVITTPKHETRPDLDVPR